MARKTADKQAWRATADGDRKYRAERAIAQRKANESGRDFGLEFNDLFREVISFALPQRQNRYGHELRCEVVMCEDLSKCQVGHGPGGR
jgi:hypothetical protein